MTARFEFPFPVLCADCQLHYIERPVYGICDHICAALDEVIKTKDIYRRRAPFFPLTVVKEAEPND